MTFNMTYNLAGPLGKMFTSYVGKIKQYVDCVTKKP